MQRPHRVHVKYHFSLQADVSLQAFVPVFHRWIQRSVPDELLIDVHNYSHVHHGAGILLVGHEGDYAADESDGRSGLLYRLKRGSHQTLADAVRLAVERANGGVDRLLQDSALKGKLEVDTTGLELAIPDRLRYPNDPTTFSVIEDELVGAIRSATGAESVSVEQVANDRREPLTIRAHLRPAV